ncbi:SPOR domain-containing protein [Thermophagus sp. OGC60D27]|uniref:SPOR domain-containing protein n=1 Tax=Thermophagus sp. OGC60D27 TaxID=3458415 RepID=UPI004037D59D
MEQYLLELIRENNRVILPDFGAFIISRDAGATVLFNNFLTFNDGLVINYLSDKEGIESDEASKRVAEFVGKIKQELDENGEYTLQKIGSFIKDQNGILRFTQDPAITDLISEDQAENEKSPEDSGLLDLDSDDEVSNLIEEETAIPMKEEVKASVDKDKSLLNLEERSVKSEATKSKTIREPQPVKSQGSKGNTPVERRSDSDRGGRNWLVILLIILIPLALLLFYFLFVKDKEAPKKSEVPVATQDADTLTTNAVTDSAALKLQEEEMLQKQAEAQKKEMEAKQTVAKGPRHHIIVGGFQSRANADKLVQQLKQKGYNDAFVFQQKNLFMVSAASYKSLNEARQAQEMFLQKERLENWILTRR